MKKRQAVSRKRGIAFLKAWSIVVLLEYRDGSILLFIDIWRGAKRCVGVL
jgi:hypothetical protein